MTASRYLVISTGPQITNPDNSGGGLKGWPSPPQISRTVASIISASENVTIRLISGSLS